MSLELIFKLMKIPEDQLESVISSLRYLVDERTSAPWASYSDDELADSANKIYTHEDVEAIREDFKSLPEIKWS